MDYRIEEREAFEVIVKASTVVMEEGKPNPIPALWDEFFAAGLADKVAPVLGVCGIMQPDSKSFPYGIGDFKKESHAVPEGFEVWSAPASTWAVFKCVGPMPTAIQDMWEKIHDEWLPTAEYEHASSIIDFELHTHGDTSSPDYVSEIWLPVGKK